MPSHSYTIVWSQGSQSFQVEKVYTADGEKNTEITVPNGTTNQQINIALEVDPTNKVVSVLINASVAMTLKTNSSGTPQETFSLTANSPILYRNDDGRANIFAGDVTSFFVTNASGAEGILTIKILEDVTP